LLGPLGQGRIPRARWPHRFWRLAVEPRHLAQFRQDARLHVRMGPQEAAQRDLAELRELGRPIVLGTSRKSFIGRLTGRDVDQRLGGTIASNVLGLISGADVLRVHEVAATRDAVTIAAAIAGRPWRRAG